MSLPINIPSCAKNVPSSGRLAHRRSSRDLSLPSDELLSVSSGSAATAAATHGPWAAASSSYSSFPRPNVSASFISNSSLRRTTSSLVNHHVPLSTAGAASSSIAIHGQAYNGSPLIRSHSHYAPPSFGPPSETLPPLPSDLSSSNTSSKASPSNFAAMLSSSVPLSKPPIMPTRLSQSRVPSNLKPAAHSGTSPSASFIQSQLQRFSQSTTCSGQSLTGDRRPISIASAAHVSAVPSEAGDQSVLRPSAASSKPSLEQNSSQKMTIETGMTAAVHRTASATDDEYINIPAEKVLDLMSRTELIHLVQSIILPATPAIPTTPMKETKEFPMHAVGSRDASTAFVDQIKMFAERVLELNSETPNGKSMEGEETPPDPPSLEGLFSAFEEKEQRRRGTDLFAAVVDKEGTAAKPNQPHPSLNVEELIRRAKELRFDKHVRTLLSSDLNGNVDGGDVTGDSGKGNESDMRSSFEEELSVRKSLDLNFQDLALDRLASSTETTSDDPQDCSGIQAAVADVGQLASPIRAAAPITEQRRPSLAPPPLTPLPSPPRSPPPSSVFDSPSVHFPSSLTLEGAPATDGLTAGNGISAFAGSADSSPKSKSSSAPHMVALADALSSLEMYLVHHARFPLTARYQPRIYSSALIQTDSDTTNISLLLSQDQDLGGLTDLDRDLMNFTIPVAVLGSAGYDELEREIFLKVRCRRSGRTGVVGFREVLAVDGAMSRWNQSLFAKVQDSLTKIHSLQ